MQAHACPHRTPHMYQLSYSGGQNPPIHLLLTLLWHEFGVVPGLPLEVLIGADVLAPHHCALFYLKNNQKRLQIGQTSCQGCVWFQQDPNSGTSAQLKFVGRSQRKQRNRLKISTNFFATPFDGKQIESDDEDSENVVRVSVASEPGTQTEHVESGPPAPSSGENSTVKSIIYGSRFEGRYLSFFMRCPHAAGQEGIGRRAYARVACQGAAIRNIYDRAA